MTPAEIARGLQETSDAFFWSVGFLTTVAVCGGFLRLRLGQKWRALEEDLKRARWRRNVR